jgi:hypothetical protein
MKPLLLMDAAKQCREIWTRTIRDIGNDLGGFSVLDLMADNIPNISLLDLKTAILAAGIHAEASRRIQGQIASYR